jgi:glycosyltransferase involved in cell wall biosynthesis
LTLPRVVLITRRFWPLVGGAERMMARLAIGLAARGCAVTVLTARWEEDWPAEIHYGGVPVVRLVNPSQRGWGTLRYMLALGSWLRHHANDYDLIYVSMLKHDAHTAVGTVEPRAPVVLRAEGAGATGDCQWQREARFGRCMQRRCRRASCLVAPGVAIEQELLAAGYPRERICCIPNGVTIPPPRTAAARAAARDALVEANPGLMLPLDAPLALYAGRLHEGKGIVQLLQAWKTLASRWPTTRLWIAGEGPQRRALQREISELNLEGRVLLAGVFDEIDELLAAADLFVLPSFAEGMSLALMEAMAAGLPVVASDIPGNRPLVSDGQHGLLVPPGDAEALAQAIDRIWKEPELAARLGTAARDRAMSRFSLDRTLDAHLALFENLLHPPSV